MIVCGCCVELEFSESCNSLRRLILIAPTAADSSLSSLSAALQDDGTVCDNNV